MIYPQRDNRRRRRKTATTVGIVGAVFVFVVILNMWMPSLLSPAVQAAGRPIMEARGGVFGSIGFVFNYFHTKNQLIRENAELKDRLVLFTAVERERDYYKADNAEVSQLVGRIKDTKAFTFARIISKPGFSPYDTMIIDAGEDQGVKEGDNVFASADTLIGEVSKSYGSTAVVVLFSTPERENPVLIGSTSIQAIALGKGGGNFEIKLPRNTGVKQGDTIIMASSSPKIFGTIEMVQVSPTDTFERALFKSPVDVASLSRVIIERK